MTETIHQLRIRLDISAEEFLNYYRHLAREVATRSTDGRTVRFPANILRPFVTRNGIRGTFLLKYDARGKFTGIERIQDN